MGKLFAGIDIGGTNISTGIVDENYNIIGKGKLKTNIGRPYEEIVADGYVIHTGRQL